MKTTTITLLLLLGFPATHLLHAQYTPTDPALIHTFTFNGTTYEIIKENRSWSAAAACAVARGGRLAEINSQEEQDALFEQVNNAGIVAANTVAMDGGGASYLWLGGNDQASEGNWVWNGNNDAASQPFWIGTANGSPVNGAYSNWGNEPDNWNGQDGLGFAFTDWPLGLAGQWNDVFLSNQLYYIVEFANTATVAEQEQQRLSVYPNPFSAELTIAGAVSEEAEVTLTDFSGQTVFSQKGVAMPGISALKSGLYLLTVRDGDRTFSEIVVKE